MNFLNDSEWLQVLKVIDAVNTIDHDHEFRRTVLEELRPLIPYDSAAFFLTDLSKCTSEASNPFIDPVGVSTPAGVLDEFVDSAWRSVDDPASFMETESRVFRERDCADPGTLEDSAYFHDYLNDFFVVTCNFACGKGPLGSMNLNRESYHDDFSDKEMYILKIIEPRITTRLIRRALTQDSKEDSRAQFFNEFKITNREQEVIYCLSQGLSNDEISARLFISAGTAKKHVENIYRKTGCTSRLSLILLLGEYHFS